MNPPYYLCSAKGASMVSKAQIKAVSKYQKNNYDDIKIRVKKGDRDRYKLEIFQLGFDSVNKFIIDAIDEKIEREKKG